MNRRFVNMLVLLLSTLWCASCVSSNETKVASANTSAALAQMSEISDALRQDLLVSLDNSIDVVRRVAIAKGIRNGMKSEIQDEKKGDLTTLARSLEDYRSAYRTEIDDFLAAQEARLTELDNLQRELATLKPGTEAHKKTSERIASLTVTPVDAVKKFVDASITSRRRLAEKLKASDAVTAAKLTKVADALESTSSSSLSDDLQVLSSLVESKHAISRNLVVYQGHLTALQHIHGQIEEWVMTDVNVSGKQIAELVKKHQDTLGLGAPSKTTN